MSSGSDDSQNRSGVRTNPSIQGESSLSSSSSEVVGKVNQASPASCPSTPSASGREVSLTVPMKKVGGRKRADVRVPEMRGSLDKRNAPAVRALDEELRRSATEASMDRSRITAEELEDLRLSYDIPSSVLLRAPGPEERADDPPEGFVAIYEPAMQHGLPLPMHPFFPEVLKDWNLAPCQITPNGWGQMVASYLLWVVAEARGNLTLRKFESIYRPCRSSSWYNVSPRPGQKWETAIDSPNKVYNWKERFFFMDGDWEFIPEDLLPHVSIPRRFGELDCWKPPIPKRNQGELRSKWDKVRALNIEFRSLNNLLKDDNLLASCGLMEASGPSQEAQDAAPSSIVLPLRPEVDANVSSHPHSSSNLHIDSTTSRDKGKKVVERAEEAPSQKRKAPKATEGLMRDARKARRTEEGRRSSPSLDGEPEGAENSAPLAGQNRGIRISESREELPASVMEMLPAHPSIVAVSVHRYWTSSWEKVTEEVTILERL
ncbi:Plus3 domain-containing protein [Abeliophyllum distichum]|uniref:Plus3 domain-containing protein n=1 Tax=Abeliophyllum distichum TaxID=126358 RepID=A0ABD1REI8_9LAMI